jgi:riboflavin synthase
MFTGIVTAQGEVVGVDRRAGLVRLSLVSGYDADTIAIGASICHDGCCLTVVAKQKTNDGVRYDVEVAQESLSVTTLGALDIGSRVNLERSLKIGDELGGHMVSGHVDGVGRVQSVTPDGEGWRVRIEAPRALARFIAPKGSIAVAGVSLTVNEVDGADFGVLIIPHTWQETNLSRLKEGARVNLEVDMMARYMQRLLETRTWGETP